MGDPITYCKAVVSILLTGNLDGREKQVLVIKDPKLKQAAGLEDKVMFPGGTFLLEPEIVPGLLVNSPPSTLQHAAQRQAILETGIDPHKWNKHLSHPLITCSRTKGGEWIANHSFVGEFSSLNGDIKPADGFEVYALPLTADASKEMTEIYPNKGQKIPFAGWAVNDGQYLYDTLVHQLTRDYFEPWCGCGRPSIQESLGRIPIVRASKAFDKDVKAGYGLSIVSLIVEHTYRGKNGLVFLIQNGKPALGGGKVEEPVTTKADNVDYFTAGIDEGGAEFGARILPTGIACVSATPGLAGKLKALYAQRYYCFVNCCLTARAQNPAELDAVIEDPKKLREPDKVQRLAFVPYDEIPDFVKDGMRTPDMLPNLDTYLSLGPGDIAAFNRIRVL